MARVESNEVVKAPIRAPRVVATSRNIPIRMLLKPSLTYAADAPEEVAMTAMREAPAAYRISTPNPTASIGTTMIPPPKPVSEPRKPATKEPSQINIVHSKVFIAVSEPEVMLHERTFFKIYYSSTLQCKIVFSFIWG